jgi:MFS transporter, DHA2 family, multidrug resistance protein
MTASLAGQHLPHAVVTAIESSLGGALAVAVHLGPAGQLLAHLARAAFVNGMDLGLVIAAVVALAGAAIALAWLPGRASKTL